MKKLLALFLVVLMSLTLIACTAKETEDTNNDVAEQGTTSSIDTTQPADTDPAPADTTTADTTAEPVDTSTVSANEDWRQFVKDYEAWVDDYIAFMEKYNANPTDMSLLADYAEMMTDLAEWSERADEVQAELTDTEDALEYSQELLRIAAKLSEATGNLN